MEGLSRVGERGGRGSGFVAKPILFLSTVCEDVLTLLLNLKNERKLCCNFMSDIMNCAANCVWLLVRCANRE